MGDTALLGLLGAYDSDEEDKEMQIASPINEGLQLGILSLESSRNGSAAVQSAVIDISEAVVPMSLPEATAAPEVMEEVELLLPAEDAQQQGKEDSKNPAADPFWLPPDIAKPPEHKCPADVQDKVREYIQKQEETGNTITASLKSLSGYKNPDFLQHCVKYDSINQYGSCYPKDIFDPASLPAEDFYDRLAAEWEDRQAARRNHQKLTQKAEFVSRGTEQIRSAAAGAHLPTTAASMVAQAKAAASRSKWDTRR